MRSLEKTSKLTATVLKSGNDSLTVKDEANIIYTFSVEKDVFAPGDDVIIEYTGLLNKAKEQQGNKLVNITPVSQDEEIAPYSVDNLFSNFNLLASNKLKEMTLDEKIGQLLLVRYDADKVKEAINKYKVGGFVFFEHDFQGKTPDEVKKMISSAQATSKIPLLTAVDE